MVSAIRSRAHAIRDPFEQSLLLLVHISYLQAFIDVNKRTARLASIIPLIRGDYVPQSFVEVDQRAYLSASTVVYELNEGEPLALRAALWPSSARALGVSCPSLYNLMACYPVTKQRKGLVAR